MGKPGQVNPPSEITGQTWPWESASQTLALGIWLLCHVFCCPSKSQMQGIIWSLSHGKDWGGLVALLWDWQRKITFFLLNRQLTQLASVYFKGKNSLKSGHSWLTMTSAMSWSISVKNATFSAILPHRTKQHVYPYHLLFRVINGIKKQLKASSD